MKLAHIISVVRMFMIIRNFIYVAVLFMICVSCKDNKIVLSKKYDPIYNPNGKSFNADKDFAKNYKIYHSRRSRILNKKENNLTDDINLSEKDIENQLKDYGIIHFDDENIEESQNEKPSTDSLVNKDGIDISSLKGAKFIDIDDFQWGPSKLESDLKSGDVSENQPTPGSATKQLKPLKKNIVKPSIKIVNRPNKQKSSKEETSNRTSKNVVTNGLAVIDDEIDDFLFDED